MDWLRRRGLRPSSVQSRRYQLRRLLDFERVHGHATTLEDLAQLSRDCIDAWAVTVQDRLTSEAAGAYISQIQSFYRWLADTGVRPDDPTKHLIRPRRPRRRPRPISEADLSAAVRSAMPQVRAWLVLAAWCGLRACEIAGLRRADLDLDAQTLFVRDGKGGAQRTIPLHPFVIETLQGYGLPTSGWVFRRSDGHPGPNQPWRISHVANAHLHSLGIAATIHQCRHRFGTGCYRATLDLRTVQTLMGHSSPDTTALYTEPASATAAKAVMGLPLVA